MPHTFDISGQRYNALTAVRRVENIGRRVAWEFQCDCGETVIYTASSVRRGKAKSCGCQRYVNFSTHGQAYTGTYRSWAAMIQRCGNPKAAWWKTYGGRGIRVDPSWHQFAGFYASMGDRPPGRTLDRIDPDGNYEPGNCRWATPKEQTRNRRCNRWVKPGVTATEFAEQHGIKRSALYRQLRAGRTAEEGLSRIKGRSAPCASPTHEFPQTAPPPQSPPQGQ